MDPDGKLVVFDVNCRSGSVFTLVIVCASNYTGQSDYFKRLEVSWKYVSQLVKTPIN